MSVKDHDYMDYFFKKHQSTFIDAITIAKTLQKTSLVKNNTQN